MRKITLKTLFAAIVCCVLSTFSAVAATYSAPTNGKVYRIWNTHYPTNFMYEDQNTHQLKAKSDTTGNDYSQLFLLTQSGTGFTLRNIQSGGYVGGVTANETMYQTGGAPYVFNIKKNESRTGNDYYNLMHTTDNMCMHQASGQRIVRWYPTSSSSSNHPSEWQFEEVTYTPAMQQHLKETQLLIPAAYYIYNTQRTPGSKLYMYEDADHKVRVRNAILSTSDISDVWVVRPQNGKSSLQNLKTGRYIQLTEQTYANYTTGTNAYQFYLSRFGYYNENVYWDIANKQENNWGCHADQGLKVVPWNPANKSGGVPNASEWVFQETGMSNDSVKSRLSQLTGVSRPYAGKYYRIICNDYSRPLKEDYVTGVVTTESGIIEKDFAQIWKLVAKDNNRFDLVNAYTGKIIIRQNGTKSVPYKTGQTSNGGFLFQEVADPFTLMFTMADNSNVGIHCAASQGNQAVGWNTSSSASNWILKEVTVDTTELAKAQAEYQAYAQLKDGADTYWQKMQKYFATPSAAAMSAEYTSKSADQIKADMQSDNLPTVLQDIVLKIKNQSWNTYQSGNQWEQQFRIASYKAYSDNDAWAWKVGMGYRFANMTNPTGITAYPKDNILVFVESDVPADATLEIEAVQLCSAAGVKTSLKKGLNTIAVEKESNLFVRYTCNTHSTNKKLSDFPEIKIHIEGGTVNGYFDLTKGHTDQTWKDLQSDGLLKAQAVNLKTKNIVFHMNSAKVRAACPEKMTGLMDIWDKMVQMMVDLKGLQAQVADRCNNMLNAVSVQQSYMYATSCGSYYNESTLSSVMNYENMRKGGSIWGPAHEFGHNHQNLINPHGCTEVSNNLFSNIAVFNQGVHTSRGNGSSKNIADHYVQGKHFADYNIWCKTQMYYKLWLYFHAAGNNPKFYQTLFDLLNKDPMQKPYDVQGKDEWLKMALKCCEAANADLSELFQMYGFFKPLDHYVVGDYSTKRLTATQADIDEVLAKMRAYPKKLGNIIFADDHIRRSPATYEGAPAGTMRSDYASDVAVGKMGDRGQWEDFKVGQVKTAGATWSSSTKQNDGSMTICLTNVQAGTVGYKVYDKDSNLLYIANTDTFTIPASVMEKLNGLSPAVKAAQADGTDVDVIITDPTGINQLSALDANTVGDIYNLSGVCVARQTVVSKALESLPKGVYVVRGIDKRMSMKFTVK